MNQVVKVKKAYKPRSNSVAGKLITGIGAGVERTISEWANELDCSEVYVSLMLNHLRKKGYQFRPVVEVQGKAGKVRDLSKSYKDSEDTMRRISVTQVEPILQGLLTSSVNLVRVFPELASIILPYHEEILRITLNGKRETEIAARK